jgi:hypothetical protein
MSLSIYSRVRQLHHNGSDASAGSSNTVFLLQILLLHVYFCTTHTYSDEWMKNDQLTISEDMKLRGNKYIMSAKCINKNEIISEYGSDLDLMDYDGNIIKECRGYLVEGLPWDAIKQTLRSAYAWQASTATS